MEDSETEDYKIISSHKGIQKKTNDNSLLRELEQLPFPDYIKTEAYNVYKSMNLGIKRQNNRIGLKVFCIYNAYRNFNQIRDLKRLAVTIGLNPSDLNKIFKLFSFQNTGYKMKDIDISPLHYIDEYYEDSGVRLDEINLIKDFADELIKKMNTEELYNDYPQEIAAGIISYYLIKVHNKTPSPKFYEHIGKDDNQLKKIMNKIGTIYNS